MPTAYPESRLQRGYASPETTFGTAVAPVAADAFLFVDLKMDSSVPLNKRPDKTGSLGQIVGTAGKRVSNTGSMRCSLAGSGTAGTPPDIYPFLDAGFGAAGTVVAATSVTYNRGETAPKSISLWDYNALATASQRALFSAIVQSMKVEFGADFAYFDCSLDAKVYADSDILASLDTEGKCGLSAWPAEPASPVTSGTSVKGYKGTVTLDGQTYTTLSTGTVDIAVPRPLYKTQWGSDWAGDPANGETVTTVNLTMRDDDSANLKALKAKSTLGSATPVNLSFAIGTVAGNIWTINCKQVVLTAPVYAYDQTHRTVSFNGCQCNISAIGLKDDVTLVCT